MKPCLFLCAFLLGQATHLWAQTASPAPVPPLTGPAVQKRAPDYACWSIIVTEPAKGDDEKQEAEAVPAATAAELHGGDRVKKGSAKTERVLRSNDERGTIPAAAKKAPNVSTSTITKAERIIHVEHTDEHKQTWNVWIADGREFSVSPDVQTVAEVAPPANRDVVNPLYSDFSKTDFPGFEWVTAKNFAGVEEVDHQPCLVFRDVLRSSESDSDGHTSSEETLRYAAVDYYSRLPVAVAIGDGRRDYAFKFPPRAALIIPENVAHAIQTLADERKATERAPSKPF